MFLFRKKISISLWFLSTILQDSSPTPNICLSFQCPNTINEPSLCSFSLATVCILVNPLDCHLSGFQYLTTIVVGYLLTYLSWLEMVNIHEKQWKLKTAPDPLLSHLPLPFYQSFFTVIILLFLSTNPGYSRWHIMWNCCFYSQQMT